MLNYQSRKHSLLIMFIMIQVLIILVSTSFQYYISIGFPLLKQTSAEDFYHVLLLVSVIISILTIFTFKGLLSLMKKEAESQITENRLRDSQEMVQVLRANQHDFINHLQVISGAAQLGRLDVIKEYSMDLVKQVKEISVISNISYPEIAALLYTKIAKGEEIEAEIKLNINTTLKDINISSVNLSRILGNLLDNALYALEEVEPCNRKLAIDIFEDESTFTFTIFNELPIIPEELCEEIFKPGFTTKGENGSGLGLYNVKTIVEKYHGNIGLISNEGQGTSFIVTLNK